MEAMYSPRSMPQNMEDKEDLPFSKSDAVNRKDSTVSPSEEVESSDNDDDEWILVTQRKSRKRGDQHPKNTPLSESSQHPQNVSLNKSQHKRRLHPFFRNEDNKGPRVLKSDFSPEVSEQRSPKPVKLEEFFPKGFLNENEIIIASTGNVRIKGKKQIEITITKDPSESSTSEPSSMIPKDITIATPLKASSLGKKKTPSLRYVPKVLKETCALPLVSLANNQVNKPLEGFIRPSEGAIEHESLHQEGIVHSYGPNAYRLIAKAGFDLSKPTTVDELHTEKTTEKLQEITDAHQKLINEAKGRLFSKAGLGCEPPKPIQIHGKKNDHSTSIQHISVEIVDEVKTPLKYAIQNSSLVSVFDRLGNTSTSCVSHVHVSI
ncbi:hypothetical protein COLO4_22913 [Corchorus olitorius]|uniref:Uncharacterized protein n=1 Tax=Corchorus olitorius TaxID=93759 RepID=A0A1R3IJ39_9ROSI|nr:hypothetical protein COLO4_22913 [Corchorus olitorius]